MFLSVQALVYREHLGLIEFCCVCIFVYTLLQRPEEKRGGAWMDECASRSSTMATAGQAVRLPIAHMVCNQSPPVGDKPSLMTFREVCVGRNLYASVWSCAGFTHTPQVRT